MPTLSKKWKFGALLGILVLALALRAAACFLIDRADKDAVEYIRTAEYLVAEGPAVAFERNPRMPPLYSTLIAAGEWSGAGAYCSGYAISVLFGALLVLPVFFLSRALFGEAVGLAAAFICATHPYFIKTSAEIIRDSLFLFLLFSSLALAFTGIKNFSLTKWFLAGLCCALAALTRSEGSEIIFAAILWTLCCFVLQLFDQRQRPEMRKSLAGLLFLLLGFATLCYPAERYLQAVGSTWGPFDARFVKLVVGFANVTRQEAVEMESK